MRGKSRGRADGGKRGPRGQGREQGVNENGKVEEEVRSRVEGQDQRSQSTNTQPHDK